METLLHLRVLLIEDNDGDARYLQELLKEPSGTTFHITHVTRLAQGLEHVASSPFDIVLLDLTLPDARGIETVVQTKAAASSVPIVVLTGFDDEAFALKAVREGAQDYLTKGKIETDLLVRSIRYAVERQRLQALHEKQERQLREFQKMEAFGQLAAGVAHDFNNFLSIIQGHLHALMSKEPPAELVNSLTQVSNAADSAAELTRQLLMISRQQTIEKHLVNLGDILQRLANLLTGTLGKSIDLRVEIKPELPAVLADPGMLEQVVLNLAVNARDAMPDGGTLTLAAEATNRKRDPSAPAEAAHTFARLSISDTGHGIDTATIPRVFEPFFSTKATGKGTGLGLAMVYGIVNQHEGWIDVKSEVGKGTTFEIFLPAVDPSPTGKPSDHSLEDSLPGGAP